MPGKITLEVELNPRQVEALVGKLPLEAKIRLTQRFERETYSQRWDKIFQEIDKSIKRHPVTEEEIDQEIEAYRKEKHAQSNY